MRIMMLTWEFPPRSVGGLAQHVHDLSGALAAGGDQVEVVTCAAAGAPEREVVNGVVVHRVNPFQLPSTDFLTWILQLNLAMTETAVQQLQAKTFDLIHAHDWLVAYCGRVLKHAYRLPLLATIHATEHGRNWGLHNDLQRYISDVEWWLCFEAWRVIVCSRYMEREVQGVFQLPADKVRVIPNGVDLSRYRPQQHQQLSRDQFAAPHEKIVFFVGRLVQEKGAHLLIEAVPKILHYYRDTKIIIAGRGQALEHLKWLAQELGVYDRIFFTGYIDDATRDFLYRVADVAVFPSLYEPFGMVVLEAMAAHTPVVVSDVGGLSEIVNHEVNGLKCYPNNSGSLADNVLKLLYEPELATNLAERAWQELQSSYTWQEIAEQTRRIYQDVISEFRNSPWGMERVVQGKNIEECGGFREVGRYSLTTYRRERPGQDLRSEAGGKAR